jgi:hypothetical protein
MPIEIVVLPADERSPAMRMRGIVSISVIFLFPFISFYLLDIQIMGGELDNLTADERGLIIGPNFQISDHLFS